MSKICTTIEQSNKLIELGLDINTADMYWRELKYSAEPNFEAKIRQEGMMIESPVVYSPAWSLTALMEVISKANDFDEKDLICSSTGYRYEMYYKKAKPNDMQMHNGKCCNNPLDTAFDMLCWLLENKKL